MKNFRTLLKVMLIDAKLLRWPRPHCGCLKLVLHTAVYMNVFSQSTPRKYYAAHATISYVAIVATSLRTLREIIFEDIIDKTS